MLEVDRLMVFYENALAVNNVTLSVERGEIVGLLGSNGAGKSTLMSVISGLMLDRQVKEARRGGERITVLGAVRYLGEDIAALPAWERVRRGIVLCPERRRVFAESSVAENLRLGAHRARRVDARAALVAAWTDFPVLHRVRERAAGFLSGGEQQLLAVARAIMSQPALLLVDEPLLGLAPAVQGEVIQAIRAVRDRGATVFIAEQYARPLLPILDRAYVIESGAITLAGTARELEANPHFRSAYFGVQ
jgi:branched-chain amino acid transport system ATP-binding protein